MSAKLDKLLLQAFPVLSEGEIALLRPFGEERVTRAGDVIFEVGDPDPSLVVVLAGQIEVVDRSEGREREIARSGPGQFAGELGLLTGQTVYATCIAREPGAVLVVPAPAVHEVIETLPALSDVLVTAFSARRMLLMRAAGPTLTLIGQEVSPAMLRLMEFVTRNRIPHRWLPPDDPAAIALLDRLEAPKDAQVSVVLRGQKVLADPSPLYVAKALGLDLAVGQTEPADLIIIGTGPAGLSAAVYAASEGLSAIAVDDVAIGGQAGASSRIENYLGFPTGISGGDLAFLAEVQALKFGARITVPRGATALRREGEHFVVCLDNKTELIGRSVVIATGARYRRLGLPDQERYEGNGIYYAATELEARRCRKADVVVVGGGNSAGQAAMYLAETAKTIHLVYRGANLGHSMSQYLIARLEHAPNVRIRTECALRELHGGEGLEAVTMTNGAGETEQIPAAAVFVMIGSDPCTDWVRGTVDLDEHGFILTSRDVVKDATAPLPYLFQTSLPGVFAVGDVRSGSVKRVASAVGEGSVVVQAVHRYLREAQGGEPVAGGSLDAARQPSLHPLA